MIPRFRPDLALGDIFRLAQADPVEFSILEDVFAKKFGYKYCIWFPYARIGVQCFLECLPEKGYVAVSPFNCLALGNGIAKAGCSPSYIDTNRDGFNQDTETFVAELAKTDVVAGIEVSLWGHASDLEKRGEFQKPILFDFALRSLDLTKPQLGPRDGVLYSLGWGKPVTGLGGGFLCGDAPETAELWRQWQIKHIIDSPRPRSAVPATLRGLAFHPLIFGLSAFAYEKLELGSSLLGDAEDQMPGDAKTRPSSAQALKTLQSLAELESLQAERRAQILFYIQNFKNSAGFRLPESAPHLSHFAVRVEKRDELARQMKTSGIFCSSQLFARLLCDYPWLTGRKTSGLENSRELTKTTLHLPLYRGLGESSQQKIVHTLKEALHAHSH